MIKPKNSKMLNTTPGTKTANHRRFNLGDDQLKIGRNPHKKSMTSLSSLDNPIKLNAVSQGLSKIHGSFIPEMHAKVLAQKY